MTDKQKIFSDWVGSFADALFRRALYKLSDREQAADLVQETFVAAWENHSGFKGDASPKTWLFSILNNKIVDVYRKNAGKTFSSLDSGENYFSHFFNEDGHWEDENFPHEWNEDDPQLLDNPEFSAVMQNCIGKLPPNWRAGIRQKYLEEKKGAEICQELGITPSNFWQILHRAKLQLRECLEQNWFSK